MFVRISIRKDAHVYELYSDCAFSIASFKLKVTTLGTASIPTEALVELSTNEVILCLS